MGLQIVHQETQVEHAGLLLTEIPCHSNQSTIYGKIGVPDLHRWFATTAIIFVKIQSDNVNLNGNTANW